MDNQNHNDSNTFSWMMGLMMLCCLLPLALAFFGGSALLKGRSNWWIGGLILVFAGWHFWMMRKGCCHFGGQKANLKIPETSEEEVSRKP